MDKQGKVVICNIIMIAISIVAIVTLILGSFMKISLSLHITGDNISSIIGEAMDDGNTGNVNTAEPDGESENPIEDMDIAAMLKDVELSVSLAFDLKSKDLLGSVFGNAPDTIKEMVKRELASIVDSLINAMDSVIKSATSALVDGVLNKAEEEIRKQLQGSDDDDVTDAEIKQELEKQGITEADVTNLKNDIGDAVNAVLDGEPEKISDILRNSETLDKLIAVYAKEEITGEDGVEPTEDEVNAKVQELKNGIIEDYESAIEEFKAENGEINKDTILVGLMQNADIKDENGNPIAFETVEDIENYVAEQLTSSLGAESMDALGMIMKALGIFLMVVIAAWAYFLIKLIVKTLFVRNNKTVGMFFPRFFGWMPHIIFVGLPMLVVKNLDKIADVVSQQTGEIEEASELIGQLSSMISLKITSLTWVSALCTVLLMVIWFPYYQWRRRIKKEIRYEKRSYR